MSDQPTTVLIVADDDATRRVLSGWSSVEIVSAIDAPATVMRVDGTWSYLAIGGLVGTAPPADDAVAEPGREFIVEHLIGTERARAARGWVDTVDLVADESTHELSIGGRSFTGDLLDCTAFGADERTEWRNNTDRTIIQDIAEQLGIDVDYQAEVGDPLPRFAVENGEKGIEAIQRIAAMRSLLVYDDADGRLVIARASDEFAAAEITQSAAKAIRIRQDASRLFDRVRVRAQEPSRPAAGVAQKPDTFGEALDVDSFPESRPDRVLVIDAEAPLTAAQCKERANWEQAVRFGQAIQIEITLAGWARSRSPLRLWAPNLLVHYTDRVHGIDDVFLTTMAALRYSSDGSGHTATLRLQPPAAFEPKPPAQRVAEEVAGSLRGPGRFPLAYLRGTAEAYQAWKRSQRGPQ